MTIHRRVSISLAFMAIFANLSQGCFGLSDRRDAASQDSDGANPLDVPSEGVDVPNATIDVPTAAVDVPNVGVDSGVCPMGTVACAMSGCANLQSDPLHCGSCDMVCRGGANGMPACAMGSCSIACNAGFTEVGGRCLANGAFPRPVLPISLGDVSLRRPTLRWELPAGADGAVVELCRDRACMVVIDTIRAMGTSVRPTMALPAGRVVFWRLRAAVGAATHMPYSPTWLFHVPAVENNGGVDTSENPHLDVNGDGYDDVAVGSYFASPGGRLNAGTASVFHGGAMGIPMAPTRVLEGVAPGDRLGNSVASAGDVNGDGFGDLVIGAYQADPGGRSDAGTASVFYGSAGGISMAPVRVLEGAAPGDHFGLSVASAGDVNGDGFADVVVGARFADPGGRMDAGTASVFHGSAAGISMAPVRVLEGGAATDLFGYSVASAGDVNGDGFSDLVIGAWQADPGGRTDAGTASVFHGSAMGIPMAPARVLEGVASGDAFGLSVASAGDVNGDGFRDVVIGAWQADPGGRMNAGAASVFHGSAMGIPMAPARVLEGVAATDLLGVSVASAGDVNGDGYGDLVIGANGTDPGGRFSAGTASVFHGSVGGIPVAPARVLDGAVAGDQFGRSVASLGDVNGDGFGDVAFGAFNADPGGRSDAGTASVFHGSAGGISMAPVIVLEGVAATDLFGYSVASAGAVNSDGFGELVASGGELVWRTRDQQRKHHWFAQWIRRFDQRV